MSISRTEQAVGVSSLLLAGGALIAFQRGLLTTREQRIAAVAGAVILALVAVVLAIRWVVVAQWTKNSEGFSRVDGAEAAGAGETGRRRGANDLGVDVDTETPQPPCTRSAVVASSSIGGERAAATPRSEDGAGAGAAGAVAHSRTQSRAGGSVTGVVAGVLDQTEGGGSSEGAAAAGGERSPLASASLPPATSSGEGSGAASVVAGADADDALPPAPQMGYQTLTRAVGARMAAALASGQPLPSEESSSSSHSPGGGISAEALAGVGLRNTKKTPPPVTQKPAAPANDLFSRLQDGLRGKGQRQAVNGSTTGMWDAAEHEAGMRAAEEAEQSGEGGGKAPSAGSAGLPPAPKRQLPKRPTPQASAPQ